MALFKVLLVESAAVWHDSLPADTAGNWDQLKTAFETRYNLPGFMKYQHANELFNMQQSDMSVDDFYAKMQRLPQPNRMHRTSDITCFNCNAVGHRKNECSLLKQGGMNTTAAMQIVTHDHPQVYKTESSCEEQGITCREVELSCGCKMPIVAGAVSPEGHHKVKHWRTQDTPCCVGRVNGDEVLALRDTGSTTCVVKTELVRPEQIYLKST